MDSENKQTEPDWKAIAMEIWNDFDNVALFIESQIGEMTQKINYPFLEKNLPTRFKYFRFHKGRIMTIAEYEEAIFEQKELTEKLYQSIKQYA